VYNLTNYKQIKVLLTERVSSITDKFAYLEKIINIDDIMVSYIKNPFDAIDNQELYIIIKNKFACITWEPFTIRIYNFKEIVKTETEIVSPHEIKMKTHFSCGDTVEIDSKADSNSDWEEEYYKYIFSINKYLANI
jgi:hypothetical protein